MDEAKKAVEKAGLEWRASSIRAGLIACTGSRGCKFSAADTKTHAEDIADWCEARVKLDQPVNIHLTGCPNSCAQHYIGDIGLVAARVSVTEEGETVDGYHIVAGGGFGATAAIGREVLRDVKAEDAPARVEGLLKAYLSHRTGAAESFQAFLRAARGCRAQAFRRRTRRMNAIYRPPPAAPMIPENAPFSPEQRAWLNGFFAGLLASDSPSGTALPAPESAALAAMLAPAAAAPGLEDDGAPWHDQTLPLGERMKLADGRPLPRRMMAAMGQQDCGQCGYNCEDYANAIATQAEERLNLCVPGAKETARMLKTLVEEMGGGASDPDEAKAKADAKAAAKALDADIRPGRSRNAPAEAVFVARKRLNREGSEKATYHVEFDISSAGLDYEPGDSFGLFPMNDEGLVERVIAAIGAPHDFPVAGKTLHQVFREDVSLGLAPDMLFELISYITGGVSRAKAKALAKGGRPGRRRRDARCAGGN